MNDYIQQWRFLPYNYLLYATIIFLKKMISKIITTITRMNHSPTICTQYISVKIIRQLKMKRNRAIYGGRRKKKRKRHALGSFYPNYTCAIHFIEGLLSFFLFISISIAFYERWKRKENEWYVVKCVCNRRVWSGRVRGINIHPTRDVVCCWQWST